MKQEIGKGIILDTRKWREADLILNLLLDDGSTNTFLATNALRSKKRFGGGVLEPSHLVSISWQEKKEDRKILNEAKLLNDFSNIRHSYSHIETAMAGIKLLRKASQEGLENPEIYNLLGNFLMNINEATALDSYLIHFKIRLLKLLGVLPSYELANPYLQQSLKDNAKIQLTKLDLMKIQSFVTSFSEDYFS